jgi:hypothetical protein
MPAGVQVDWLGEGEYVPAAQAMQTRSFVALPGCAMCSPGSQVVHASQLVAFVASVNVPLSHALQVWSLVALPGSFTCWPAVHGVQTTHAVLGSPSSSQVPVAQAIEPLLVDPSTVELDGVSIELEAPPAEPEAPPAPDACSPQPTTKAMIANIALNAAVLCI